MLCKGLIPGSERAYIATGAPLESCFADFFRMLWLERVPVVLMLTRCKEGSRSKADPYWPEVGESATHGLLTVTCMSESERWPGITHRELRLVGPEGCDPGVAPAGEGSGSGDRTSAASVRQTERVVILLQNTSWPDFGVPSDLVVISNVLHELNVARLAAEGLPPGPAVVHCSAGIGRTGTLIALDIIMQQARYLEHALLAGGADGKAARRRVRIDVPSVVQRLREQRAGMVMTRDQYALIYAFLDYCFSGRAAAEFWAQPQCADQQGRKKGHGDGCASMAGGASAPGVH